MKINILKFCKTSAEHLPALPLRPPHCCTHKKWLTAWKFIENNAVFLKGRYDLTKCSVLFGGFVDFYSLRKVGH